MNSGTHEMLEKVLHVQIKSVNTISLERFFHVVRVDFLMPS